MHLLKNIGFTLSGLACLYIAYITGTGEILNYIDFADPLNELFFCAISLMMGSMLIYIGLSKDEIKVPCSKELDNEWYNESI